MEEGCAGGPEGQGNSGLEEEGHGRGSWKRITKLWD